MTIQLRQRSCPALFCVNKSDPIMPKRQRLIPSFFSAAKSTWEMSKMLYNLLGPKKSAEIAAEYGVSALGDLSRGTLAAIGEYVSSDPIGFAMQGAALAHEAGGSGSPPSWESPKWVPFDSSVPPGNWSSASRGGSGGRYWRSRLGKHRGRYGRFVRRRKSPYSRAKRMLYRRY